MRRQAARRRTPRDAPSINRILADDLIDVDVDRLEERWMVSLTDVARFS
jgi:hypothetical protein